MPARRGEHDRDTVPAASQVGRAPVRTHASLLTNASASLGGYVISAAIAFLISPFIIRSLGDARYGAWSLVAELIGYYGLLDLGLRGAVSYYVAVYLAREERENLETTIASAFWTLAVLGGLVVLAGLGVAAAFPHIFPTAGLDPNEVRLALIIMAVTIGFSLPVDTLVSTLVGFRRLDVLQIIEVLTRALIAVGTYFTLRAGGGLIGLSLVNAGGRALSWAVTAASVRAIAGGLFIRLGRFRREQVRALAGYGLQNLVGHIAILIINRMDLVVVGLFLGLRWVTYYSIGITLVRYVSSACASLARSFMPELTHLHAREHFRELERVYLMGTRVTGLLSTLLLAGMAVFGTSFIRLWVGAAYVTGPLTHRSDVVMLILSCGYLPRLLQSMSWQLLFGSARVRFLMWLSVAEAIANLALSLLLVQWVQLAGVALGTLIPQLVAYMALMPAYILRTFKIPLSRYVLKGVSPPLATGAGMLLAGFAIRALIPPVSWRLFTLDVAITAAVGALLAMAVGFTAEDRQALLSRAGFLRRIGSAGLARAGYRKGR